MALTVGWRLAGISFIERYFRTVEDWGFSMKTVDAARRRMEPKGRLPQHKWTEEARVRLSSAM